MRHRGTAAIAIVSVAVVGLASMGDCPRGGFDYGPPYGDPNVAQIVIDHYGAGDPLLPTAADYERALRDVGLIYEFSGLTPTEIPNWVPTHLILSVSNPADEKLLCLNDYYAAKMSSLGGGGSYLLVLPQPVNLFALAAVYESLPVVNYATIDVFGCGGLCCASPSASYEVQPNGTWDWHLTYVISGPHGSCSSLPLDLSVTAKGEVFVNPDLNSDDSVNAADVAILLGNWGPCTSPFGSCLTDLNLDFATNGADLAILLGSWS